MARPDFLRLPPRSPKPRLTGLTHVLDKGISYIELEALLESAASFIDLWKFGWGTAYLDSNVEKKVATLTRHGIRACVGGTLLEVAWLQGETQSCLAWAAEAGFPCVEVSNGVVAMPLGEKRRLIAEAADRFTVLAEVGSKDPLAPVTPSRWADEMAGDLQAGAAYVLAEGRESGTVGLYTPDGNVRGPVVDAVVSACGLWQVVFEAPRKDQQAWFICRFGAEVNLGNVLPADVVGLEALRLGLRADTISLGGAGGALEATSP